MQEQELARRQYEEMIEEAGSRESGSHCKAALGIHDRSILDTRSPSSALLPFFWGRVPLQKKGYPYSNLSTGGPRIGS